MAYTCMHTVRSVHDHSSLSYSYVLMHAFMGLTLALVLSKDKWDSAVGQMCLYTVHTVHTCT